MTQTTMLAVGVGLAVLLIALLLIHRRAKNLREAAFRDALEDERLEAAAVRARLEERSGALADLERRNAHLERGLMEANQAKAALSAKVAASEKARREQAELLEKSESRLREAFAALSREALGRNSEMFMSLAKAQLGEFNKGAQAELEAKRTAVDSLVKPIGDTLDRMGAALEAAEKARAADVAGIVAVHRNLSETTGRLVKALHHSSARGHWGELQLRRVAEIAGMLEHCDFEEQVTVTDGGGRRLRPDLVVRLVGGRVVVVDAKTPMDSYLESQEADNEAAEKELRQKHAKAVKMHMTALGAKAYWSQFSETPEFVVMFFPNEAVFAEALRVDPGLIEYGMLQNVIPASPATLLALLKSAAYGWQQQRASENARTIFAMGRELHNRFATEYKHLAGIGSSLSRAVENYNKVVGSAERMLFPALRRFGELTEREMFPPPEAVVEAPKQLAMTDAAPGGEEVGADNADAIDAESANGEAVLGGTPES